MPAPLLPRPRFWAEAAKQKQTRYSLFGELLMFVLVYMIASMLQGILLGVPTVVWMLSTNQLQEMQFASVEDLQRLLMELLQKLPDWLLIVSLFTYAVLGAVAVFYCAKVEKRSLFTMGLGRQGAWKEYGSGALVGLLLTASITLLGVAAGGYQLGGFSERHLWSVLLPVLLGCMVRAAAEELLFRGYLTVSLSTRLPVVLTVGISVLVQMMAGPGYGVMPFIGLLNHFLLAVFLCVYIVKRGSLWGACAIHAMWTFCLGSLFGFDDGTAVNSMYWLKVNVTPYHKLITGGEFGPEASICATIALLAGLAVLFAVKAKDPAPVEKPPIPEAPAEE